MEQPFNYEKSRKLGYSYQTDFLAGKAKTSKDATWHGRGDEIKYINETMKVLYNDDFSNISFQGFDGFYSSEEIPGVRTFILPYGFCLLLGHKRLYKFVALKTQTNLRVVLVDPYSSNSVVLKESVAVDVGPTLQDEHSLSLFKAKFEIIDQVC